ncbi:MAG: hypothetical protein HY553_09915 [Elusimicrobia bacterium]|nr:hypothetical protein [Elusimicrobiota bacterium]
MPRVRAAVFTVLTLSSAGLACAHRGYGLDESTRRIYARSASGRVTKWYEPGTEEYEAIARRFWPHILEKPTPRPEEPGRRDRMNAFMRGLDRDQWHILLDLDLWTGDDKVDLSRLEDIEQVARAVKGMPFNDFLELKRRYPIRSELRAQLLKGD